VGLGRRWIGPTKKGVNGGRAINGNNEIGAKGTLKLEKSKVKRIRLINVTGGTISGGEGQDRDK